MENKYFTIQVYKDKFLWFRTNAVTTFGVVNDKIYGFKDACSIEYSCLNFDQLRECLKNDCVNSIIKCINIYDTDVKFGIDEVDYNDGKKDCNQK